MWVLYITADCGLFGAALHSAHMRASVRAPDISQQLIFQSLRCGDWRSLQTPQQISILMVLWCLKAGFTWKDKACQVSCHRFERGEDGRIDCSWTEAPLRRGESSDETFQKETPNKTFVSRRFLLFFAQYFKMSIFFFFWLGGGEEQEKQLKKYCEFTSKQRSRPLKYLFCPN